MAHHSSRKKNHTSSHSKRLNTQRTSVFSQIVYKISMPLVLLSALFVTLQLTNQIASMNELHQAQTPLVLETLHRALKNSLDYLEEDKIEDFKISLSKAAPASTGVLSVDIMNMETEQTLFNDPQFPWDILDQEMAKISIENARKGKLFSPHINTEKKWLTCYMPILTDKDKRLFTVRVIFSLNQFQDALMRSRLYLIGIILSVLLTGVYIAIGLSGLIIKPLKSLSRGTQDIMEGRLGTHIEIETGNEFETLATAFNQMSDTIKDMKKKAEDSNPLTQLPGNQGIVVELNKRIQERQKFVLFHTDLNRFKVFNDHYGLALGDKAIAITAETLKKAAKEKGAPNDFVGHQGGDDFVYITRPSHAEEVAKHICKLFDTEVIQALYNKEDIERGYTLHEDRRRMAEEGNLSGEIPMAKFPLLSIGLAGISNVNQDFADHKDCLERVIEIKKDVKKTIESSYLIR